MKHLTHAEDIYLFLVQSASSMEHVDGVACEGYLVILV